MFCLSAGAGVVLWLGRLANPFMFGPLLAAIALTARGLRFSSIPTWMTNLGQLLQRLAGR